MVLPLPQANFWWIDVMNASGQARRCVPPRLRDFMEEKPSSGVSVLHAFPQRRENNTARGGKGKVRSSSGNCEMYQACWKCGSHGLSIKP